MFESFNALANEPMCEHTTLKLGGPADYLVFPRSAEEINALFAEAGAYNLPVTVIGHGSNLLVLDGGIRGLVICIGKNMRTITREGNMITAQAGAMLGSVAVEAAEAGLSGLEFASGIPGTVGGGVTMNAGAYNGEMSQVVKTVKALSPGGKEIVLSREEMDFSYRHSAVTEKNLIVTEATFELQPRDPATIRAKMSELHARRAEKQPLDVPSAGSTFKRPEGFFAAALIDQCGLKGYSIGGARVSMKHAGFLVNTGTSSKDFYDLMQKVQQIVEERVGVKLEPEIKIIGEALPSGNQGSIPQMNG